MLRAIGWFLWGCICWLHTHIFSPLGRMAGRLKPKKLFSVPVQRMRKGWSAGTTKFTEKARRWAFQMENPEIELLRKAMVVKWYERQRFVPPSVVSVYERLRIALLTGKWEQPIQQFYYLTFLVLAASLCLSPLCLLFASPIISLRVDKLFLFIAMILLVSSYALFRSILSQISTGEKWILRILVLFSLVIWLASLGFVMEESEQELPPMCFVILTILCLASLTAAVSISAFLLQWRLLRGYDAISRWMMMNSSSYGRQGLISSTAAWLLLMAPGSNGKTGWQSPKEIDHLMEINRVEREGAEWRSIVFAMAALIGLANLGKLLSAQFELHILLTPADPAVVAAWLMVLSTLWGILLEIWLSEFPNQIIGFACVRAKHFLTNQTGPIREFENYRVVEVSDPESLTKGPNARWSLIDKHPLTDGGWRCLVQARVWLDSDERNEEDNQ